ncbi:DUF4011 domain-containing protein [Actinoplanes sp. M2I2]|uniref:DUF4011 domain-containing protein n=1 Tax=Actinoplanes sp. M2I2 TaxID=1734444 RepID=UPI0020207ACE|nr:DUF4011 domain-containing protein [Actinoplanes sp. M2I2]
MGAETPRAAVRAWRDGLVNLDAGNRLLNLRPGAGSLEIAGPAAPDILAALRGGRPFGFLPGGAKPAPGCLFRTGLTPVVLGTTLRRLLRRSRQELLDRGVATLHLAIGSLRWRDEEGAAFTSPVLLVPVELTTRGPGDQPRLLGRDDDPVVNPALALRLRRMGITMPRLDGVAELDARGYLEALSAAVSNRGWPVDEGVLLACFSFHKEAMYRDLLDNESRIVAHPLVRALAGEPGVLTGGRVERRVAENGTVAVDGDELPLVLDADATQRACVEAALSGQSFVLDGPPGTGKSQTIANLIGCLLHAGKRVLFVSEKAAALDVVRNRLAAAGLEPYLLELHSHKATRKEVARALTDALAAPAPSTPAAPEQAEPDGVVDRNRLREVRDRLDAYAIAMNERREPLGRSLHEVLGDCARLGDQPELLLPADAHALTPDSLRRTLEAAEELGRCRRAAVTDRPVWREVTEPRPLRDTLHRATAALRALRDETEAYAHVAEAYALSRPADAVALAALVTHLAHRPPAVDDAWLTAPGLEPIERAAERRGRLLADADKARAAVRVAAGVEWHELPDRDLPALDQGTLTAAAADLAARRATAEADALDELRVAAGPVAARLGLPAPVTFADLARFAALAELAGRGNRPEPYWFGPGVLAGVADAAAVLHRCAADVAVSGAECRRWFFDAIVDEPVEQLADRLTHEHRGLRKLLPAYRRDWDAVAAHALPTVPPAEAVAHLGAAVAWQRALRERAAAERRYAPLLGRYRRGEAAIDEALRTAGDLLRLSPPEARPAVADQICRPAPDPALVRLGARARTLAAWGPPAATLLGAAAERRAQAGPFAEAAAVLPEFGRATGRPIDLAEARRLAGLRRAAADREAALTADAGATAAALGPAAVDAGDLVDAVAWAKVARRLGSGADAPLTGAQAGLRVDGAGELAGRVREWVDAREAVVAAFAPGRRAELAAELDDYDGDLLTRLLDDETGQDEWLGYQHARDILGDAAVASGLELPAGQIGPAVERALLTAWGDAVIRDDERLRPVGGPEHDRLVEEFRRLDAALTREAPAAIGAAIEARRSPVPDEVALLRREGMKQSRHLPVRELIDRARTTVQSAKPCFLMSPLAVSQYLPPDLTFDVVIFDEASQIAPADAVNCVYRATSLIAAGDDRQLPPTSFFSTRAEADDGTDVNDFQSVLELAEGCGAFPVLRLGRHYRSRHEALIAFANHRFYQGRLLTFPGADADPENGVEFVPAAGVYRRGGARDNPEEAEKVAQRIVTCLTTRPELSLGVVTFSVAQAEAIESAVERAATRHPGLERLLGGDRLTGFFVKSLESVQGDERDVMIFSVGYGRDEHGRISSNFGALNQPNGWRRLNVAITRARRRVEIISSVRSRDIPESPNPGVRLLAAYLDFAERGLTAVQPRPVAPGPLAAAVLATVRSWGYDAQAGVGGDGYRIDVGVRHPTPGRGYLLGIECDGPLYGSLGAARDRDRLSAEILTGLGWRLHRVWGTAWHRDRAGEEKRLREAIDQAVGPLPARRPGLLRLLPVS